MADITDPEVIKFSNDEIRPISDQILRLYYNSATLRDGVIATGIMSKIPNSPTDDIIDGSTEDGRHPITGEDVNNVTEFLQSFLGFMEADGNKYVNEINRVAVNPYPTR